MSLFHSDMSYAAHYLSLARVSESVELKNPLNVGEGPTLHWRLSFMKMISKSYPACIGFKL
jgi:hypothetical protein